MFKRLGFSGVVMVGVLSVSAYGDEDRPTVRIRDQEHAIWPLEDLIERGFEAPLIPRKDNAAWVYMEAINAYAEPPDELEAAFEYAYRVGWPAGQDKLAEYLSQPANRAAIDAARRASRMERCQMPCFGDPSGSVISVLLPSLSPIRVLSKLMVAEGRRLESQGRYTDAAETYLAVMRMGEHLGQGVTLIEGLVGIAVWSLGDRALVDLALRQRLSPDQLKKLMRQFNERTGQTPSALRGLRGETTFGPVLVDELCSRPLHVPFKLVGLFNAVEDDWFGSFDWSSKPVDGWGRLELRIGQLFYPDRAIKQHMVDFYDLVLQRAEQGPFRAADLGFDEREYILRRIPRWDVISRAFLPSLSRATLLGERVRAEMAAMQAIAALRLYMLENEGLPPDTLSEILDKLPEGALADPFSDDLLHYRLTEDGWLLYSVGPNLIDDGGQVGKKWDELDLVWQFPPIPVEPFDDPDDGSE